MEKNLIPAPIDNKNLCEDPFEDDVFEDFYPAKDHREKGQRHLYGFVKVYDEEFPKCVNAEGHVEVSWKYGGNTIVIKLLANNPFCEEFEETFQDIAGYYKKLFKSWEDESSPDLAVRFGTENDSLYVHFYWDTTKS